MGRYAENTSVSVKQSRDEIERTLTRYGASKFMQGWDEQKAVIGFEIHGKQIKIILPLPDPRSREITHTPKTGVVRSPSAQKEAYEQLTRQRWRALALLVKAKLEAVESGISMLEKEFLGDIVLPGGSTVSQYMLPQIEECYKTGKMPPLLPMPGEGA